MGKNRKCERCKTGTETCAIGDFYTCDLCDNGEPTMPCSLAAFQAKMNQYDNWDDEELDWAGVFPELD